MSLRPEPIGPVPAETARVAHSIFQKKGNRYTLPFGKAARATRTVSSGMVRSSKGCSDIGASLRQGDQLFQLSFYTSRSGFGPRTPDPCRPRSPEFASNIVSCGQVQCPYDILRHC